MASGLKATQQTDGGWSSLEGRSSDAYSTGEALYALHEAGGIAISDSAWQRGIDYLLRTQTPDGVVARGGWFRYDFSKCAADFCASARLTVR